MRVKQVANYLRSWDIFGHPVSVHYKGEDTFKTMFGFFVTTAVFGLIISNFVTLSTAFMDGSKQEEKSNSQVYDRHGSPVYNLTESGLHIVLYPFVEDKNKETDEVSYRPLTNKVGRYFIEQYTPCDVDLPQEDYDKCRSSSKPYQKQTYFF